MSVCLTSALLAMIMVLIIMELGMPESFVAELLFGPRDCGARDPLEGELKPHRHPLFGKNGWRWEKLCYLVAALVLVSPFKIQDVNRLAPQPIEHCGPHIVHSTTTHPSTHQPRIGGVAGLQYGPSRATENGRSVHKVNYISSRHRHKHLGSS